MKNMRDYIVELDEDDLKMLQRVKIEHDDILTYKQGPNAGHKNFCDESPCRLGRLVQILERVKINAIVETRHCGDCENDEGMCDGIDNYTFVPLMDVQWTTRAQDILKLLANDAWNPHDDAADGSISALDVLRKDAKDLLRPWTTNQGER